MQFNFSEEVVSTIYSGLLAAEEYAKKVGAEAYLEDILDARQALINQEEITL